MPKYRATFEMKEHSCDFCPICNGADECNILDTDRYEDPVMEQLNDCPLELVTAEKLKAEIEAKEKRTDGKVRVEERRFPQVGIVLDFFCPDCGESVVAEYLYCPHCGKKLNFKQESEVTK